MKFAVTVTIDTVTWMNVTVSVNSLSVAFGTTAPVLREGLSFTQTLCSLWARPPSLSISPVYCFY